MDGIARLEKLAVGWAGREEESGDESTLPLEVLPPPPPNLKSQVGWHTQWD